jgi:hypothetical protein
LLYHQYYMRQQRSMEWSMIKCNILGWHWRRSFNFDSTPTTNVWKKFLEMEQHTEHSIMLEMANYTRTWKRFFSLPLLFAKRRTTGGQSLGLKLCVCFQIIWWSEIKLIIMFCVHV